MWIPDFMIDQWNRRNREDNSHLEFMELRAYPPEMSLTDEKTKSVPLNEETETTDICFFI